MKNLVVLAKLVAKNNEELGYSTYVFECLEDYIIKKTKYILCTRYPNWEHRKIDIGEIGYLCVAEVQAGIDKWFDGSQLVYYKYDNIQFIKFIAKPNTEDNTYVM